MRSPVTNQLELATELVEVLSNIAKAQLVAKELEGRRDEILTSLHDGLATPPDSASRGAEEPPQTPATNVDRNPVPAEPVMSPDEAMALYEQGVEKVTPAQSRMIWALITKEHGVTDEENVKRVIKGIVAEEHVGTVLESTKDLSKQWAGDVITYLQSHPTKDLEKWVVPF